MLLIGVVLLAARDAPAAWARRGASGAGVPRRDRGAAAQRPQTRTGDPHSDRAGRCPPAQPHPVAGQRPRPVWVRAFAHPEDDKRVAVGIVVMTALAVATSLAWTARSLPACSAPSPDYWHQAADWLTEHNTGKPVQAGVGGAGRRSPPRCGVTATMNHCRSSAKPLGSEGFHTADPAADDPRAGFGAAPAARPAVARPGRHPCPPRHLVCGGAQRPRSGHIPLRAAVAGAPGGRRFPGLEGSLSSATRWDRERWTAFISDSGLRPRCPAVGDLPCPIRSGRRGQPPPPYLADADRLTRVDGGGIAARLDRRRHMLRQPPLGRCCWPRRPAAGRDDPAARRRRDRHRHPVAARRLRPGRRPRVGDPGAGDPRNTFNRVPDCPAPGAQAGAGRVVRRPAEHSQFRGRRRRAAERRAGSAAPAAVDGDSAAGWVSNALQVAVGQWLRVITKPSVTNATLASRRRCRRWAPSEPDRDRDRQQHRDRALRPTGPARRRGALPYGRDALGADHRHRHRNGSSGVQFGITDLSAITQYDAPTVTPTGGTRHTVVVPGPRWDHRSPCGIWVQVVGP